MRRYLLTLALAGVFGVLAASDASACHKKKCGHAPAPTPCVVVEPCPPPPPPVCEVVAPAPKCGMFKHLGGCGHKKMKMGGLCHKKAACAPAPVVCETAAPAYYATPSPQASAQGMATGQGS